ncbi:MAG: NRDE family protein [Desulfobacterales bacterium]
MCLILFAYDTQPGYRLIMAANRDEFYLRPTAPLAAWADAPEVYGGRDDKEGGTWLGVSRKGRISALTNYRDPAHQLSQAPSRGLLTSRFLAGDDPAAAYLEQVAQAARHYNGFNLLTGDRTGLWYFSNRGRDIARLPPGLYGVSNHLIDTPWPKVSQGKKRLKALLERRAGWDVEDLFALLADRAVAPDKDLPDTGVGLTRERTLSPLFIASPDYGTRSSTVLLIETSGPVTFAERTFTAENPSGETRTTARCEVFTISPWPSTAASDPAAP